jgi:hypothetical protein
MWKWIKSWFVTTPQSPLTLQEMAEEYVEQKLRNDTSTKLMTKAEKEKERELWIRLYLKEMQ